MPQVFSKNALLSQTLISPLTQNAKLSHGVATTYRPVGDATQGEGTCSPKCPLLASKICYAQKGLVGMQMRKARDRNDSVERLGKEGVKLVRLHTSGDFFNADGFDTEYFRTIVDWCGRNPDVTVWTYCHDVTLMIAAGFDYLSGSIPSNLHIVASVDDAEEKAYAMLHGFRTAETITDPSQKADDATLCPYDLALFNKEKPKTKCDRCQLCFNPNHKKNIAFVIH